MVNYQEEKREKGIKERKEQLEKERKEFGFM